MNDYFEFPANFTDIEQQSNAINRFYIIPEEINLSEKQILNKLRQIDTALFENYFQIKEHQNFDFLYLMIKHYQDNMQFRSMKTLQRLGQSLHHLAILALKGALNLNEGESATQTRIAFKMSLFLVFYFITTTALKKPKTGNDMMENMKENNKQKENNKPKKKNKNENIQISKALIQTQKLLIKLMKETLDVNFVQVWERKEVQSQFFKKYTEACVKILESTLGRDEEVGKNLFYILQVIIKAQPQLFKRIQIALINLVYENQVPDNLVSFFSKADGPELQKLCTQTIILIVVYLLQKSNLNAESSSIKNTKQFLTKLSDRLPKLFYNNLSCFIRLYQSDSYHLRNAISDIIMNILKYVVKGDSQEISRPRQKFITTLLQRIYDKSSYCRSYVLGILAHLTSQKVIPRPYLVLFLKAGVDRVKDNSVNTRKKALQLINTLIDDLCPDKMNSLPDIIRELQLLQLDRKTLSQEQDRIRLAIQKTNDDNHLEELDGELKIVKKRIKITQQNEIKLLQERQVTSLVTNVVSTVQVLLGSKTDTDVLETIRLFIRLNKLNCQSARDVLPKIRLLIFSRQRKIKDEVLSTFMHLHLSGTKSQEVAQQLIRLFTQASLQDKSALEQILQIIISQSVSKGLVVIKPQVFAHLWNNFIQCEREEVRVDEKRVVLTILRVAFTCEPNLVKQEHMESFLNILKKHIETKNPDFHIIKEISRILQLNSKIVSQSAKNFLLAQIYILVGSQGTQDPQWYSATQHVLSAVYQLCENPQKLTQIFIKKLHIALQNKHSSSSVAQFLFTLSHSCLKMLIHLDSIENKIKAMKSNDTNNDQREEEQLDKVMGGQQAELQKKVQQIQALSEKILQDPFISRWILVIERIVDNIVSGDELEIIAVLSYCKFMCISPQYCSKQIPKLLKLLNKQNIDPVIKNNIIIAIGDLLHRFPNIVQPYSKHLYQNLHDNDPRVRKTTLTVLTHLSLNDMIKVKGDMCEIALLFQDPNAEIESLVKQFFHEMNKKDPKNIFNLIPDALGRFSCLEIRGNQSTFEVFLKNILPLLEKDKFSESLVAKLCQRMSTSLNLLQIKNTAYCLSELNLNQKAVRKILQNFQQIRPKLEDPDVLNHFRNLINKLRKYVKLEFKSLVDELEEKITHSNEEMFNAQQIKKRNEKVYKKQPGRRRRKTATERIKVIKTSKPNSMDVEEINKPQLRARKNNHIVIQEEDQQAESSSQSQED